MNKLTFTEDDKKNFITFLNFVAKEATFTIKTDAVIEYFKLLTQMQKDILPKIDANILEIKKVTENALPAVPKE